MPILLYRAQIGNITLNPCWVLYNTPASQFKNACNRTKYSSSLLLARIIASIPAAGLSYMCENKTKCVNWSSKDSWICVHLAPLDSTSLKCVTRIRTDHGQRLFGLHPSWVWVHTFYVLTRTFLPGLISCADQLAGALLRTEVPSHPPTVPTVHLSCPIHIMLEGPPMVM
jgi:hypothetical protein